MAPAKNSHNNLPNMAKPTNDDKRDNSTNTTNGNSNSNISATAPAPTPKQTGTVPKAVAQTQTVAAPRTTRTIKHLSTSTIQQQQGRVSPVPSPTLSTAPSPPPGISSGQQLNLLSRIPVQQRKNTEIVAPIRRDFNDLNDYLLTTVVDAVTSENSINNFNNDGQKQQELSLTGPQQIKSLNNSSSNSGGNNKFIKQQQHQQQNQHQQQQQQHYHDNISNTAPSFDTDNLHENQRYCYPVRPIPRRNLPQQQHGSAIITAAASNLNTNLLNNQQATIGVVIPTTPASSTATVTTSATAATNTDSIDLAAAIVVTNPQPEQQPQQQQQYQLLHQLMLLQLQQLTDELLLTANSQAVLPTQQSTQHQQQQQQQQIQQHQHTLLPAILHDLAASTNTALTTTQIPKPAAAASASNENLIDLKLLQQLITINLAAKRLTDNNLAGAAAAGAATTITTTTTATTPATTAANTQTLNTSDGKKTEMVHEINPNSTERDVVVNSTSLEDVALSEMSDNRAQSILSLDGSVETPTPENTPSYDDLQQRLESSNRNIQNIQEQQQQLLRLQNAAKQHLREMETLRQHANSLSFAHDQQNGNVTNGDTPGNGVPDYQSIEQVHSDMATLVGRVNNLTSFIQNQNDLSRLLGEDAPEIRAEQNALERKLETLRSHRDEMRSLVNELEDINRHAEKFARESKDRETEPEPIKSAETGEQKLTNSERVVPVEYSRVVPIELLMANTGNKQDSASTTTRSSEELDLEVTAANVQQNTVQVDAMQSQLKRLKAMMETVNRIEAHSSRSPKQVGRSSSPRNAAGHLTYDRDRTPTAGDDEAEADIARRMRKLNDVTSDLRSQAEFLEAERTRIKALKEEIGRHQDQAAAAAQLGEDALLRHSLTPTPTPAPRNRPQDPIHLERDQLKAEYEAKKREFECLCQRVESESPVNNSSTSTVRSFSTKPYTTTHVGNEIDEDLNTCHASNYMSVKPNLKAAPPARPTNNSPKETAAANNVETRNFDKLHLNSSNNASASTSSIAAAATTTTKPGAQEGACFEAGSLQSGSSRSYSIPSPMRTVGGYNLIGPIPGTLPPAVWNPTFCVAANPAAAVPPPPVPGLSPPNFTLIHGMPVQAPMASTNLPANTSDGGTGSSSTLGPGGSQAVPDPLLIPQFVQTQQMLINSVCQCNQLLWHQQREIDALNNTICLLQDRLYQLGGPCGIDLAFNFRSESVPPPSSLINVLPTALYSNANRAQSEQPAQPFVGATERNGFPINYAPPPPPLPSLVGQQGQQYQHLYQQRHRNLFSSSGGYTYTTDSQQQNATTASTSHYSTLNNAAQQPPPPPPQFNNEAPQSPLTGAGPGPIFMHHHNNAIHQNNANLRTQNHHANLQPQQQQHTNNGPGSSNNTLNNQVPPGNRANNYWDNFRSYSRQNLFSTSSNKSNEEHQLQQQQQQQQQQQRELVYERNNEYDTDANLHRRPLHLYPEPQINNTHLCSDLSYDDSDCSNKYLRGGRSSRANLQLPHGNASINNVMENSVNNRNRHPFVLNGTETREYGGGDDVDWRENNRHFYNSYYNIIDSDISRSQQQPATTTLATNSSNLHNSNMNMNINFGNSPHYQRNKVPAKSTYRTTSALQHNRSQPYVHNIDEYTLPRHIRHEVYGTQNQRHYAIVSLGNESNLATTPNDHNLQLDDDSLMPELEDITTDSHIYTATQPCSNPHQSAVENLTVLDENDTTSEEIKRNLLVNALKNDKFTTKFYESIKEDVFRRLESMLIVKDSSARRLPHPDIQSQEARPLGHQHRNTPVHLVNNVGDYNKNSGDPLRKIFLNARMGNQQQQSQHGRLNQEAESAISQFHSEAKSSERGDEQEENDNTDTESNNGDSEAATAVLASWGETSSPRPQEKSNAYGAVAKGGASTSMIQEWRQNVSTNTDLPYVPLSRHHNRKRKNLRKDDDTNYTDAYDYAEEQSYECDTNVGSSDTMEDSTISIDPEQESPFVVLPDYELIDFVMTRVKAQTHIHPFINDALLVEIVKITANSVQICSKVGNKSPIIRKPAPNVSPKKMFAKMKKLCIPRRREEFIIWYQHYLTKLYLIEVDSCAETDALVSTSSDTCSNTADSDKQQHDVENGNIQKSNIIVVDTPKCDTQASASHHIPNNTREGYIKLRLTGASTPRPSNIVSYKKDLGEVEIVPAKVRNGSKDLAKTSKATVIVIRTNKQAKGNDLQAVESVVPLNNESAHTNALGLKSRAEISVPTTNSSPGALAPPTNAPPTLAPERRIVNGAACALLAQVENMENAKSEREQLQQQQQQQQQQQYQRQQRQPQQQQQQPQPQEEERRQQQQEEQEEQHQAENAEPQMQAESSNESGSMENPCNGFA